MKHKLKDTCVYYFLSENLLKPVNKKLINRIVSKDFFIENEIVNVEKIYRIDNYKKYYYIFEKNINMKFITLDEKTQYLRSAEEIKNDTNILLRFENKELIYLNIYLKTLSSPKKYLFQVIQFYRQLLHSINIINTNNIIHNNIDFHSIVVDNNDNVLLANFSFSIDTSRSDIRTYIKQFVQHYDPSYIRWPIEFHLLAYLLTNKLASISLHNIETVIDNYIEHNNILKNFGNDIVDKNKKEAIQYFKKYINKSYDQIIDDVLLVKDTWDNYSFSIMYLKIIISIHNVLNTKGITKNKFIILFMKLLVTNISLNPNSRYNIEETTNKFESIIDNLDAKDYIEIIDKL